MKRIETYIYHWFAPHFVFRIYSIYLEWKGLRLFRVSLFVINSIQQEISILYTLNEKDWDNIISIQEMSPVWMNLFYIPWMKRIETKFLYLIDQHWSPDLFYIPWMKRIETKILFNLFKVFWVFLWPSFDLFYIPWMKRIETSFD